MMLKITRDLCLAYPTSAYISVEMCTKSSSRVELVHLVCLFTIYMILSNNVL